MYPILNEKLDNNKPILLIGNSPNIKNYKLGEYINEDNFNIIRFNFSTTKGFEKYIGNKTTYRIINGASWNRRRNDVPKEDILIAEPTFTDEYKILCKYPTNIEFKSIHIIPIYSHLYIDSFPTSGFIAISFFLQFYKYIYIYGFSFTHTHYFDINKNRNDINHHNYNKEKIAVDKLILENRIIYLSPTNCNKIEKINNIKPILYYNSLLNIYKNNNNDDKYNNNQNNEYDENNEEKKYKEIQNYENNKKRINSINIINVKYNNSNNNYFLFNNENIIQEGDTQYCKVFSIKHDKFINIIIWGYFNSNEDCLYHGKCFDDNIIFDINDILIIDKYYIKIKVLCNKHKFGEKGVYFHYNNNEELKKTNLKYCYIPKLNIKKEIITWNTNNGGNLGNAHGRYIYNKKKYDFYPDDILVLLN